MENSSFNNNNFGIFCDDSNAWNATNCQSSTCVAGIELRSCTCWTMKNCDFSNNSSSSSNAGMFLLGTTLAVSGAHIFEDCTFCNNSSTAGSCQGVNASLTSSCIFKNCSATGNAAIGAATGFLLSGSGYVLENCSANGNVSINSLTRGFSSTGTAHYLIDCTASGNRAGTTGVSNGIFLSGIGHIAANCTMNGNVSPTNIGSGVFVNSGSSSCLLKNCTSIANIGNVGSNSRGFFDNNSAGDNLWIGNIAFGQATNYTSAIIPFISVAATGPYPLAGFFDNRDLTNISFD
jgi:hypothetical protein